MAIGKIQKPGKGFGGALGYAVEKDGAVVLDSNLAADPTDVNAAAAELAHHARTMRPDIEKPVQTLSISLPPGEKMSDDQWRNFVADYLEDMGWTDTKYVAVKHTDTGHEHVHIVMSRVKNDGTLIKDSNSFIRQEHTLDNLEVKYGLTRVREAAREAIRERPMVALDNLLEKNIKVSHAALRRAVWRVIKDPTERDQILAKIKTDRRTIINKDGKYTTREVEAEGRRLKRNLQRVTKQRHSTRQVKPRESSAKGLTLTDEQQAARRAVASGRGLVNITGYAGAGKTTLLEEARKDLESQGRRVIGCAIAGKAAAGLQEGAGIESSTIARMLMDIKAKRLTLDSHTVIVVDEAGMVDRAQLDRLMQHAADAGAAVRLVGDSRQLRPVGRGGGFNMARQIADEIALTAVRRQHDTKDKGGNVLVDRQWMRDASAKFGDGEAAQALKDYQDKGRVQWSASRGSARARIVKDYAAEVAAGRNTKDMIVMAHRRDDVHALNAGIRDELKAQGKLGDETIVTVQQTVKDAHGNEVTTDRSLTLAAGDRLVMLKNDKAAGLKNGEFGTVVKVAGGVVTVNMDNGRREQIDTEKYNHIAHGYAATIHKEQGDTRDEAFVLASDTMDSHLSYVSMTRHREDVTLYANRAEFATDEDLRESLSKTPDPDELDGETESETLEEPYDRDARAGNAVAAALNRETERATGAERGTTREMGQQRAAARGQAERDAGDSESRREKNLRGDRAEAPARSEKPVRVLSHGYLEKYRQPMERLVYRVSQSLGAAVGRGPGHGRRADGETAGPVAEGRTGAAGVRGDELRNLSRGEGARAEGGRGRVAPGSGSEIVSQWRNRMMSFANWFESKDARAEREMRAAAQQSWGRRQEAMAEARRDFNHEKAPAQAEAKKPVPQATKLAAPAADNKGGADSDNKGSGRERYLGEADARNVGRNADAFGQHGHVKAEIGAELRAQGEQFKSVEKDGVHPAEREEMTERYVDSARLVKNDELGTFNWVMRDEQGQDFLAGNKDGPYQYDTEDKAAKGLDAIESDAQAHERGGKERGGMEL
jgi:Ti-type conjugative transfer relaxase TraA